MSVDELFEASRDLVILAEPSGRIVFRNRAALARHAGETWSDAFPREAREASAAAFERATEGREPASFEWADGAGASRAWFSAELTPVAAGVLCISREITALKRVEDRLRQAEKLMVDTQGVAHLGLWEWDISQPTATWSAELFRIYGLTSQTYTPSYEAYLTMVHPDDRQRVIDATNRVFHEHVPYSHDERIFRPDGTMRYLHTWAFPVLDENGKLTHLIGVCQDITDRALAEEALQRANVELEHRVSERTRQLEEALRELEGFNSMVSHDLRAPLAVISMSVHLLQQHASGKDIEKYFDRINRSVANMASLLDDLLTFARVGQNALTPQRVDVSALCSEVVAELRAANPQRDASVTIQAGIYANVDPALFRVVLANLIGNAWKYTGRTPSARIEIFVAEREGGRALCVRDNGIGFAAADAGRLFVPFVRLKNATVFSGSGIGLATVKRIIDLHGGTVLGESVVGEGATFCVTVPSLEV